jgi:hypothetical protein
MCLDLGKAIDSGTQTIVKYERQIHGTPNSQSISNHEQHLLMVVPILVLESYRKTFGRCFDNLDGEVVISEPAEAKKS